MNGLIGAALCALFLVARADPGAPAYPDMQVLRTIYPLTDDVAVDIGCAAFPGGCVSAAEPKCTGPNDCIEAKDEHTDADADDDDDDDDDDDYCTPCFCGRCHDHDHAHDYDDDDDGDTDLTAGSAVDEISNLRDGSGSDRTRQEP